MIRAARAMVAAGLVLSTLLAACARPNQSPHPSASKPPTTTVTPPTNTAPKPTPTPTPSASAAPKYGGTLNVIEPTTPLGPIGAEWEVGGDQETEQFVMEHMATELLDGTMGPAMATSWDVNSDPANASITFHLRQGVKFTDGSDWNAQDFAWNIDIYTNPGKYVPGDNPAYSSTTLYWKSVDII